MTVHATPSERFDRAEGSSPLRSDRAYYDVIAAARAYLKARGI